MAAANFNRIARLYRSLEYLTLGRVLERCRTHFLPQLLDRKHALVLGDGDGRFLAALLAANPQLYAVAVDTSDAMLRLLRARCAFAAPVRLETHHGSVLDHCPAPATDLVVTHFFLDCLTQRETETLIATIADQVRPDARWLISEFRVPNGWLRLPARLLVRLLYFAFRLLTGLRVTQLPGYEAPLTNVGFVRFAVHHTLGGVLTTELWQRGSSRNLQPL